MQASQERQDRCGLDRRLHGGKQEDPLTAGSPAWWRWLIHLTLIDQISAEITRCKNLVECCRDKSRYRQLWEDEIKQSGFSNRSKEPSSRHWLRRSVTILT